MTHHSRRHKWQLRWVYDDAAGTCTHESGLVVRETPDGPRPENAAEIIAALTPKNGAGNAPLMVARMVKEAGAVFAAGGTFRARL